MSQRTYPFEKEIFTERQFHLDYTFEHGIAPIQGDSYQQYISRLKLHFICRQLVAQNYRPPFFGDQGRRYVRACTTGLGLHILDFLARRDLLAERQLAHSTFHQLRPDLDVITQIADAALSKNGAQVSGVGHVKPLPIDPSLYERAMGNEINIAVGAYADLASQMHYALHNSSIKTAVKNFRRNAIERHKQLVKVTNQALERYPSIRLIRLDFGYRAPLCIDPDNHMNQAGFETGMAQLNLHRQLMVSTLRAMFDDELAFYVWKIEHSYTNGPHIHWLLGIDVSSSTEQTTAESRIQAAWHAAIKDRQTYTFSVNALDDADHFGLRTIDTHDPERWAIVERYIDHLLTSDHTLKLRMPSGMRAFGSSKARRYSERRLKSTKEHRPASTTLRIR